MHTYTTGLYTHGTEGGREFRAKSPETLARRLYGRDVDVREHTARNLPSGPLTWWEVYGPTGEWLDDIFLID